MLPEAKLDALLARHAAIEAELSQALAPEAYVRLSREFAELSPVADRVKAYRGVAAELTDLDGLIEDAATDPEMRAIAMRRKAGAGSQARGARTGNPHRTVAQRRDG